jgi:hypothetical protein
MRFLVRVNLLMVMPRFNRRSNIAPHSDPRSTKCLSVRFNRQFWTDSLNACH